MTLRFLIIALFGLIGAVSLSGQDNMDFKRMDFKCEDLKAAGLVLVPVTSPDYPPLLADIEHRIDHPAPEVAGMNEIVRRMAVGRVSTQDRAISAILLNQSNKSIAAMELVWTYEEVGGRTYTRSHALMFGSRLLLPFGTIPAGFEKIQAYWNTILPGSKRYLGEDGMAGDNTDVRVPAPDEVWKGGGGGGSAGGNRSSRNQIKSVTLTLDGVFFTDGEFVGPNQFGIWESITSEAKARLDVAKAARDGKARGIAANEILGEIIRLTGPDAARPPAPPPPGKPAIPILTGSTS